MHSPYLNPRALTFADMIRAAAEYRSRAAAERSAAPGHAAWLDHRANTLEAQAVLAGAP